MFYHLFQDLGCVCGPFYLQTKRSNMDSLGEHISSEWFEGSLELQLNERRSFAGSDPVVGSVNCDSGPCALPHINLDSLDGHTIPCEYSYVLSNESSMELYLDEHRSLVGSDPIVGSVNVENGPCSYQHSHLGCLGGRNISYACSYVSSNEGSIELYLDEHRGFVGSDRIVGSVNVDSGPSALPHINLDSLDGHNIHSMNLYLDEHRSFVGSDGLYPSVGCMNFSNGPTTALHDISLDHVDVESFDDQQNFY